MKDEAGKTALADAVQGFFEAGNAGNWEEAAMALTDAVSIAEMDMEGEEEGPEMGGEKKPLAAILIGAGPKK